MAKYHYDEAGNMAAYFLLTFLAIILIPITLSLFSSPRSQQHGCNCNPCLNRRKPLKHYTSKKTYLLLIGWSLFGYISYKVANAKLDNKVYDPFEILGIRIGTSEKDIKSHYKKLSRLYHPDKVKPAANLTIEAIQNRFVEITKAYKSLTDETIRENLEKYGHPDGRQDVSMGIALPQWIVERKNNIWVLGIYGLLFGGALPALVGRWWFGSRQKTKDGVHAQSAAAFFKSLNEESSLDEVIGTFGKAYQWELRTRSSQSEPEIGELERIIQGKMGFKWNDVSRLCDHESRRKALVLIYAHLLRLPIHNSSLQKEQTEILLQAPLLLSALLNISTGRSWLLPTLAIMRLHAYLVQAVFPGSDRLQFAQLPGIKMDELTSLAPGAKDMDDFVQALEEKQDERMMDVQIAMEKWGRIQIVDAAFNVIGERSVTPSAIVFLVVKLRLSPPCASATEKELDAEETKQDMKKNEEKDEEFLASRKEMEDIPSNVAVSGWAHAPYWPGDRKPSWWLVLADEKSNRVVVPPIKISDVPFSRPNHTRNYRSYKVQFQAPQSVGMFTWKVQLVSDTFIGEDVTWDISLKIEDISSLNADDQQSEDEISDPDEDTLAGQMAVMRGGAVKKRADEDEESDEESSTDDDEGDNSSESDSDSD